jgi:hypothetical protein
MPFLVHVEARPISRLLVEFSDGVRAELDLSSRLFGPVFRAAARSFVFRASDPRRIRRAMLAERCGSRAGRALQPSACIGW